MGCTEPIAIAYAASVARQALGRCPDAIKASFSGNIIKNVKSVIVPMTDGQRGIDVALATGIIANAPERHLEVLCALSEEDKAGTVAESGINAELPFDLDDSKLIGFQFAK